MENLIDGQRYLLCQPRTEGIRTTGVFSEKESHRASDNCVFIDLIDNHIKYVGTVENSAIFSFDFANEYFKLVEDER